MEEQSKELDSFICQINPGHQQINSTPLYTKLNIIFTAVFLKRLTIYIVPDAESGTIYTFTM